MLGKGDQQVEFTRSERQQRAIGRTQMPFADLQNPAAETVGLWPVAILIARTGRTKPDKLDRIDGTAFRATEDSGNAVYGHPLSRSNGVGTVAGSALELSTVDTADQMTKLIVAQQAYSMNSQVIQAADEMLSKAMDMKG